jgi:hypothetical protein
MEEGAVDIGLFMCVDSVEGPPEVTSSGQNYPEGTTSGVYTLTFNEDVSNVTTSTLTWTPVEGTGTMDSVTEIDPQTFEVAFSGVADEDEYTLTVTTEVTDDCGHPMAAEVDITISIVACISEFGSDTYYQGCEIDFMWDEVLDGTLAIATDDSHAWVPIGFEFTFYDTTSSYVALQTNGTASFTNSYISLSTYCLPTTAYSQSLIALQWDDLDCGNGGGDGIYYETLGSEPNRRFVATWQTERYPSSDTVFFQLVLYEGTDNVEIRYQDLNYGSSTYNNGASASSGIQHTTTSAIEYHCNTPSLGDGMALMFYRQ